MTRESQLPSDLERCRPADGCTEEQDCFSGELTRHSCDRTLREVTQAPMSEISREQQYVEGLYERVDALRQEASVRLTQALAQDAGTAQARLDRDAAIVRYSEQLSRLDAAESGLCFGRLDLQTGERLQIGRIGLHCDSGGGRAAPA